MVTDVVCALLSKDGKYLIARRMYGNETSKGKWEFPGGKVEEGENLQLAMEREMREEFSVHVKANEEILNYEHDIPGRRINLRLIKCDYLIGDFSLREHDMIAFVEKNELLNYDMCPGDRHIAEELIKNNLI